MRDSDRRARRATATARVALAAVLLALPGAAAAKKAASKGASDCTAKAVYPDGSEVERTCIVEGESGAKASRADTGGIHSNFRKLKDTRWHWNGWRDVIFRAEGSFLAPAEGCETEGNPRCRWSASEDEVYVMFGGAGRHTLQVDDAFQNMAGSRDSDGDQVRTARRRHRAARASADRAAAPRRRCPRRAFSRTDLAREWY